MRVEADVLERSPSRVTAVSARCPACGGALRVVDARAAQGPARCPHRGCAAPLIARVPYSWDGGSPRLRLDGLELAVRPAPTLPGEPMPWGWAVWLAAPVGLVAGLPGAIGMGALGLLGGRGDTGITLTFLGMGLAWWGAAWWVAASRAVAASEHRRRAAAAWRARFLEGPAVLSLEVGD